MSIPILTLLVLVPLAGALAVSLLAKTNESLAKNIALVSSIATGLLSVWMLVKFPTGSAGFEFVSKHAWVSEWGISWHLGVDGISLFLVVLTGILFPLVIVGIDPHHDHKQYLVWMLVLEAGVMGSFLSLDLFLFFVFFEIVLVPMYFLIGKWGYDQRIYAATKFFIYTMAGSAFMLVGIVATAFLARRDIGYLSFDVRQFCHCLRSKSSVVPTAHMVARRTHASANRWLGHSCWRVAEDGNLWNVAFRRVLVP
jgi:NADH-quinone oxidoreductase subunit M